jgi:hypothetical protein
MTLGSYYKLNIVASKTKIMAWSAVGRMTGTLEVYVETETWVKVTANMTMPWQS